MKRYIRATTYNEYPISIDTKYDIDEGSLESQIREVCQPAEQFIDHVDVHLGTLSTNDIRVFSNLGMRQLRVVNPSKDVEYSMSVLLRKLGAGLPDFIAANEAKQASNADGTQLLSAMAVVIRLIKQKFGYKPTFTFSDSGKIQYHLWSLPFATGWRTLDSDAIDEAVDQLDEYLEYIESTYAIDMHWNLPTGGSAVYAAWTIVVPPSNAHFFYNKMTKQYERADGVKS